MRKAHLQGPGEGRPFPLLLLHREQTLLLASISKFCQSSGLGATPASPVTAAPRPSHAPSWGPLGEVCVHARRSHARERRKNPGLEVGPSALEGRVVCTMPCHLPDPQIHMEGSLLPLQFRCSGSEDFVTHGLASSPTGFTSFCLLCPSGEHGPHSRTHQKHTVGTPICTPRLLPALPGEPGASAQSISGLHFPTRVRGARPRCPEGSKDCDSKHARV